MNIRYPIYEGVYRILTTNHTVLLAKPYSYLPATSDRGGTG